mgnify:FL=1
MFFICDVKGSGDTPHTAKPSSSTLEILPTDIGDAVGQTLSNNAKYHLLTKHWKPSESFNFPTRKQGSKVRKFQHRWLSAHPWLAYSKNKQGAFCKWCVLFAKEVDLELGQLVTSPLHEFAKGADYLAKHEKLAYHQFSKTKAESFKRTQEDKTSSVAEMLNTEAEVSKLRIRNGLESIVKAIVFLARQGLPLRGHRAESTGSIDTNAFSGMTIKGQDENGGNLLSLLSLQCSSDSPLAEHLQKSSKNRIYVSKTSQGRIIEEAARQITQKITAEIKESRLFSLMIDECGDRSNKEQLAITVRYVHHKEVKEKFLALVECTEGTSGSSIAQMISTQLEDLGLDLNDMVALTTDGAGNMMGRIRGTAAILQESVPNLVHVHCLAHNLNLVVVAASKSRYIQDMFTTVQAAFSFFSPSPKRTEALKQKIQESDRSERVKLKLKDVCRTRWVERYNSLETMLILLPDVVNTLEDIIHQRDSDWNKETVDRASALMERLTSYKFSVVLVTATNILLNTTGLCKKLQGRSFDIVQAVEEISNTLENLTELRDECDVESSRRLTIWFEKIKELCPVLQVQPCMPRVV